MHEEGRTGAPESSRATAIVAGIAGVVALFAVATSLSAMCTTTEEKRGISDANNLKSQKKKAALNPRAFLNELLHPVNGFSHNHGMADDATVASGMEHYSLCFLDKEREAQYVDDNALQVCQRALPLLICSGLLCLQQFFYWKDKNFTWRFVQIPCILCQDTRMVYSFGQFAAFILTVYMVMLLRWRKLHIGKSAERLVVGYGLLVFTIIVLFGQKYSVARMLDQEPRKQFETYSFDCDLLAYCAGFFVYFAIWMPIRFVMLLPMAIYIVTLYFVQAAWLGNPDALLWNIVFHPSKDVDHVADNIPVLQHLGAMSWDRTMKLALLVVMTLIGQRHIEVARREAFLSLWSSAELIKKLSDAQQEKPAPNSNALEEANEAVAQLQQGVARLKEHHAIRSGSLLAEIERMAGFVGIVKDALDNADVLFQTNVSNLFEKAEYEQYNTDELKSFMRHGIANHDALEDDPSNLGHVAAGRQRAGTVLGASASVQGQLDALVSGIGREWAWDPFALDKASGGRSLFFVAEEAMIQAPWSKALERGSVTESTMRAFMREVFRGYLPCAYHNEMHAATVCHIALWFAYQTGLFDDGVATDLEKMTLMVAALCHDVGHFGRNTLFLCNSRHAGAMIWNDASPLENMHSAAVFALADKEGCGILADMGPKHKSVFRSGIVALILSTDLKSHNESLTKFASRQQAADFMKAPEDGELHDRYISDKALLSKQIMQCSDVAHAGTIWKQHKQWSFAVTQEFLEQGDEERQLGLPISPLCDRRVGDYNMAKGQGFFISVLAKPGFQQLSNVAQKSLSAACENNQGGGKAPRDEDRIPEDVIRQCELNVERWKEQYSNGEFDALTHGLQKEDHEPEAKPTMPYAYDETKGALSPIITEDLLKNVTAYRPSARAAPYAVGGTSARAA
jgi:hypothetical protein